MEIALNEIPLMIFTTLAPIGAGAFLALFVAFANKAFDKTQTQRVDRFTLVPIILACVALLCAFLHLANPADATNITSVIGSSPLANEIVAFSIFFLLALIYWICAITGRLKSMAAHSIFCGIIALAGLVSAVFMGLAYFIPAIPVWNSPYTILQIVSAYLFGGVALGMLICALSGKLEMHAHADELISKICLIIGAVLFVGATILIFVSVSQTNSALVNVTKNASSLVPAYISSILLSIISTCINFIARGKFRIPLFALSAILAVIAIFMGRIVFYGMQIGAGL